MGDFCGDSRSSEPDIGLLHTILICRAARSGVENVRARATSGDGAVAPAHYEAPRGVRAPRIAAGRVSERAASAIELVRAEDAGTERYASIDTGHESSADARRHSRFGRLRELTAARRFPHGDHHAG